jgi:hypothetical protein
LRGFFVFALMIPAIAYPVASRPLPARCVIARLTTNLPNPDLDSNHDPD